MHTFFIVLISLILSACSPSETVQFDRKVTALFHSDPITSAAEAISKENFEFLATHNHSLKMPMNIDTCLLDKYGYRVLSNESLEYMSYDYQVYGAISTIYASGTTIRF